MSGRDKGIVAQYDMSQLEQYKGDKIKLVPDVFFVRLWRDHDKWTMASELHIFHLKFLVNGHLPPILQHNQISLQFRTNGWEQV
jgi:hypothetical protein